MANYDETGRVNEEEEADAAEEEEGGAAGCAVLCRDGVVGLMVAGPLRPLRLRPPSPAPRYQPPIPLVVPQGSTVLPPTKPPLVLALSESPTSPPVVATVSTLERGCRLWSLPPFGVSPLQEHSLGSSRTGCCVVPAENRRPAIQDVV